MLVWVNSYPYLGVTISSGLRWHDHISHITAKAPRTLGFILRNVYNCPPKAKSFAYISVTRSQLEYASAALDPYLVGDIQQLEKSSVDPGGLCLRLQADYLCFWSSGAPPVAITVHHTYKLQTCTTKQYTTRLVSFFIIFRNHCETLDQQTTQQLSHYQLARTHICSQFSHGQLSIGTNCQANSAWKHQLAPTSSLCTVGRLINRHT